MRAHLLYRDRDFGLQKKLPWNERDLTQDLELETLWHSMSFASPLCHKLGCRCRSWITLPPYFLQTQHQHEKLHFNITQPIESSQRLNKML
jgi:hypothetical protein